MTQVIENLSFQDYLDLEAISRSDLAAMRRGLNYYKWFKDTQKPTAALSFGNALHTLILEPKTFKDRYMICPEGLNLATKEGKAWKASLGNKEALKSFEYEALQNMAANVLTHPIIGTALEDCSKELTVTWEMEDLPFKARFDAVYYKNDVVTLFDIKSTQTLNKRKLRYSIKDYGYDLQACLYSIGARACLNVEMVNFVFVWIQKTPPYDVYLSYLPLNRLEATRAEIIELIEKYKEARIKNKWPSNIEPIIEELDCSFIEEETPDEEEQYASQI